MRQSDQNNSSNFTASTALSVSSTSQRRFAGHKISKVRFLNDLSEFSGRFVSGSWNIAAPNQGCLTLWHADGQRAGAAGIESFQRKDRLFVGAGVDVNDIFVINSQQFVASMSNGDVKIVDCPIPESGAADEGKMCTIAEYPHVHKQAASRAICVLDNEIFSGSDSGNIIRIHPSGRASHAVRTFADDLMGVTGLCSSGQFLMVSSHSTGQLHLWDVRKRAMSPELGIEPLNSRPVTEVNNSITAIGVHPTQPNVITFGTQDGVVSFIDIRQTDQPLPIAFKVSQDPINELKFHPIFANNCFSLSDSGIIHWDGSMLARELSSVSFPAANGGGESTVNGEMEIMEEDGDGGNEHRNIWLSARASTSMQLRVLVEDEPKMLSTFDLAQGALLAASHTAELILITGVNFNN